MLLSLDRKGFGTISAAGGRGWAGGGGGRISVHGYSNGQEVKVTVHGLYLYLWELYLVSCLNIYLPALSLLKLKESH